MCIKFLINDKLSNNKFRLFTHPSKHVFQSLKLDCATQKHAKALYNHAYLIYNSIIYLKIV